MKEENTYERVEMLFNHILSQPPLLDENSIVRILSNTKLPKKNFRSNINKNLIFMTTTFLTVSLIGWFFYSNSSQISSVGSELKDYSTFRITHDSGLKSKTSDKKILFDTYKVEPYFESNKGFEKEKQNFGKIAIAEHKQLNNTLYNGDEFVLVLSKEELKKLGIVLNEAGVSYLNLTPSGKFYEYDSPSQILKDGENATVKREQIGNKRGYISLFPFYSCFTTNEQIMINENHISTWQTSILKPTGTTKMANYIYRTEKSNEGRELFSALNGLKSKNIKRINFNEDLLFSMDDTLVPVKVQINNLETTLFWFATTPDFYNSLPQKYRESIREFYEKIKGLKKGSATNTNLVDYPSYYSTLNFIKTASYIDLSISDLKKIGITYDNYGMHYKDNSNSLLWVKNSGIVISKKSDESKDQNVFAVYYSDSNNSSLNEISPKYQSKYNLRQLIPIKVKKDLDSNETVVFWYIPSKEFISSLPSEVRKKYIKQTTDEIYNSAKLPEPSSIDKKSESNAKNFKQETLKDGEMNFLFLNDRKYLLNNCIVANESFENTSKWELDLTCCEDYGYSDKKIRSLVLWFSIKSTNKELLDKGIYSYTNENVTTRKEMAFYGNLKLGTDVFKITGGEFTVDYSKNKIIIKFSLRVNDGQLVTGQYTGTYKMYSNKL